MIGIGQNAHCRLFLGRGDTGQLDREFIQLVRELKGSPISSAHGANRMQDVLVGMGAILKEIFEQIQETS